MHHFNRFASQFDHGRWFAIQRTFIDAEGDGVPELCGELFGIDEELLSDFVDAGGDNRDSELFGDLAGPVFRHPDAERRGITEYC